ncbi:uncharacterized protein LOC130775804 [Actinidia eriantha]|uniref:uncharacterized protein LOC130775804 n=1 Tax=Actinidia eriantha TaxID=165200 RepID=UPI00258F1F50|nr:uncharacterized protein LOC130775804 [Actinidia eriantha]
MICRGRCAYGVSRPKTEEGSRSELEKKEKRREEGGEESFEESVNNERDYQGFQAAVRQFGGCGNQPRNWSNFLFREKLSQSRAAESAMPTLLSFGVRRSRSKGNRVFQSSCLRLQSGSHESEHDEQGRGCQRL